MIDDKCIRNKRLTVKNRTHLRMANPGPDSGPDWLILLSFFRSTVARVSLRVYFADRTVCIPLSLFVGSDWSRSKVDGFVPRLEHVNLGMDRVFFFWQEGSVPQPVNQVSEHQPSERDQTTPFRSLICSGAR